MFRKKIATFLSVSICASMVTGGVAFAKDAPVYETKADDAKASIAHANDDMDTMDGVYADSTTKAQEANAAKDDAVIATELATVEQDINMISSALEAAKDDVTVALEEYNCAVADLDAAKAALDEAKVALNDANTSRENKIKILEGLQDLAQKAKDSMEKALNAAKGAVETAESALNAANEAFKEAQDLVDSKKEAKDAAQKEFNEANKAFEEVSAMTANKKAAYEKAKEAYNDAVKAEKEAKENLDSYKGADKEYKDAKDKKDKTSDALKRAGNSLASANATVTVKNKAMSDAEKVLNKAKDELKKAQEALDNANSKLEAAKANVENAKADVANKETALNNAETSLSNAKKAAKAAEQTYNNDKAALDDAIEAKNAAEANYKEAEENAKPQVKEGWFDANGNEYVPGSGVESKSADGKTIYVSGGNVLKKEGAATPQDKNITYTTEEVTVNENGVTTGNKAKDSLRKDITNLLNNGCKKVIVTKYKNFKTENAKETTEISNLTELNNFLNNLTIKYKSGYSEQFYKFELSSVYDSVKKVTKDFRGQVKETVWYGVDNVYTYTKGTTPASEEAIAALEKAKEELEAATNAVIDAQSKVDESMLAYEEINDSIPALEKAVKDAKDALDAAKKALSGAEKDNKKANDAVNNAKITLGAKEFNKNIAQIGYDNAVKEYNKAVKTQEEKQAAYDEAKANDDAAATALDAASKKLADKAKAQKAYNDAKANTNTKLFLLTNASGEYEFAKVALSATTAFKDAKEAKLNNAKKELAECEAKLANAKIKKNLANLALFDTKGKLAIAQLAYNTASAALDKATKNLEDYKNGSIIDFSLDELEAALSAANDRIAELSEGLEALNGNVESTENALKEAKKQIARFAEINVDNATFTGAALTPAVNVTLKGETLTEGKDYTVAYTDNTNVGTAKVTITFLGEYEGITKDATFTINPAVTPDNGGNFNGNANNAFLAGNIVPGDAVATINGFVNMATAPVANENTATLNDEKTPLADTQKTDTVKDEEVPEASMQKHSWLWVVILCAVAAAVAAAVGIAKKRSNDKKNDTI